jgi:hypothetical protein
LAEEADEPEKEWRSRNSSRAVTQTLQSANELRHPLFDERPPCIDRVVIPRERDVVQPGVPPLVADLLGWLPNDLRYTTPGNVNKAPSIGSANACRWLAEPTD